MPTPDDAAARLVAAMDGMKSALVERDQAVADALKAGGSVREVAAITGRSTTTIQKIGHDNGWPTPAMKRKWAEEKARRGEWMRLVEQFQRDHPQE
jgi:transposase